MEFERRKQQYVEKIKNGEITPGYSNDLIEKYEFFRKNVYEPKRVFYPCCNLDASPIKGFPNSEVVLMDFDEDTRIVMENCGTNLVDIYNSSFNNNMYNFFLK
jgi:hypothetical protein